MISLRTRRDQNAKPREETRRKYRIPWRPSRRQVCVVALPTRNPSQLVRRLQLSSHRTAQEAPDALHNRRLGCTDLNDAKSPDRRVPRADAWETEPLRLTRTAPSPHQVTPLVTKCGVL